MKRRGSDEITLREGLGSNSTKKTFIFGQFGEEFEMERERKLRPPPLCLNSLGVCGWFWGGGGGRSRWSVVTPGERGGGEEKNEVEDDAMDVGSWSDG